MPSQTTSAGQSLRALRQLAGLTLSETAEVANTSVAYLSKVETGKFVPTKGYVAQVASALAESLKAVA